MDRFYKKSIRALERQGLIELSKDIHDYVNFLNHYCNVLISELHRLGRDYPNPRSFSFPEVPIEQNEDK